MDLFGRNFVLLTGRAGDKWLKEAAAQHIQVDAHCVGIDFEDPTDRFEECYGVTETGAALIRRTAS